MIVIVTLTGFYIDASLFLLSFSFAPIHPLSHSPSLFLPVSFFCELIMQKKRCRWAYNLFLVLRLFILCSALLHDIHRRAIPKCILFARVFHTPRYPSSMLLNAERVKPRFVNYNRFVHVRRAFAFSSFFFLFFSFFVLLTQRNRIPSGFLRFLRVSSRAHADS